MLKKQLGTLFLVTCLILTTVPAVLGNPSTKVITVAGDGSGDFNCDGKEITSKLTRLLNLQQRIQAQLSTLKDLSHTS